jgi:spore cortex formation protein SpoVR/YcgB (stage V sporulation)
MNRLHEKGMISDGNMLEFIHSHAGVVAQPSFDSKYFSGFNPYALGFAMMRDIERICVKPTDEDRRWFPDFAGNGDPLKTLRYAWENFRDESFVQQFLSPEVMRKMRIFSVHDNAADPTMMVGSIHNESGYREVRRNLARQYDISQHEADIQVVNVDLSGDRTLMLRHRVVNGILLDEETAKETLSQLANLWGYRVHLSEVDAVTDAVLKEHSISPTHVLAEAA